MKYQLTDDAVTLTMTRYNYETLLLLTGAGLGAIHRTGNVPFYWSLVSFCNSMNTGNPSWTPYEIPERDDIRRLILEQSRREMRIEDRFESAAEPSIEEPSSTPSPDNVSDSEPK